MPEVRRRRKAVLVASLAASLLLTQVGAALAQDPAGTSRFLQALAKVESGGRYMAKNSSSGAYGKYQIMPSSWRAWAKLYLGNANAPMTPKNQEIVARKKVIALFNWLGQWRFVAHWWLTGSGSKNTATWSPYSKRYVAKVMHYYASPPPAGRFTDDRSASITYTGAWKTAAYGGYTGGAVHYATSTGASASFRFTGKSVTWVGPVGPTRGRAIVLVDGTPARIVNLHRASFAARVALFTRTWATKGTHTITVRVLSSSSPVVALDGFRVTG